MAFFEKNWQKKASDVAVQSAMRIVGAGVAAYATKKLTEDESTDLKKTIKNISAPLITVAGVLGSMMIADPNIRCVCEGVATFGALKAVSVVAPSVGETIGLKGVALQDMPVIMNGISVRKKGCNGIAPARNYKPIMNGATNTTQPRTTVARPVFQQSPKKEISL